MASSPDPTPAAPDGVSPPSPGVTLAALFHGFLSIGMMSVGGGLAAWTRREVVQRRAWLDDRQFLTGYALSQLVPGATNVNLAVFIGTQLRGGLGALAALAGLFLLPLVLILLAGGLYLRAQQTPGFGWVGPMLTGMGAVAIGLSLATGVRLARHNLRGIAPGLVTLATTVGIAVLRIPLLEVLLVMFPVGLALSLWRGRA